jgi:TP901 family phage tail tape measure protein
MADLKVSVILQAVDKMTAPLRRASDNARRTTNKLSDAMARMNKRMEKSMQMTFAADAVGGAGRKIGQALRGPVDAAIAFEESMSKVGAISGATGKDMAALTDAARNLGATTSFSAAEAAEGMTFLGMAGFKTNQIVASMPGLLNLARAGATDLGRASDIVSDVMSGFKLEAADMGRISNVMAKTFTSSNVTLEMLGETMKYVAPIASSVGVSLEEVSAMTGLLGNVGIKGSQAGTTLRAAILRLSAPTGAASDALADLGVSTVDSMGNMRNMVDIIGDLAAASDGMGNADKLKILKDIFGEEPAAGMAELLGQGQSGITQFLDQVKNSQGTAKQISDQMGDNMAGGIKEFKSAMESLAITVGNQLLPALKAITAGIKGIVQGMTGWAKEHPTLTKGIVTIAAVVGGLLVAIAVGIKIWAAFSVAIGAVGVAFTALKAIVLANPIGLAIAAIAAGAYLIYENWGAISEFFTGIWNGIKATFMDGVNSVLGMINQVKSILPDWMGGGTSIESNTTNQALPAIKAPGANNSSATSINAPITVNAAPGQSSEEIAAQVAIQMRQREQQAGDNHRAALFDLG